MKRAAAFVLIAVAGAFAVPDWAWSEQRTQTFILRSRDPTANTGSVFAAGPVTGVGSYVFGGQGPDPFPGQFIFPDGSLLLAITPDPPSQDLDPRTCVLRLATSGSFVIHGGTGALAGATGTAEFTGRAVIRFARAPNGECRLGEEPVFFVGVVQSTATLMLLSPGVAPGR